MQQSKPSSLRACCRKSPVARRLSFHQSVFLVTAAAKAANRSTAAAAARRATRRVDRSAAGQIQVRDHVTSNPVLIRASEADWSFAA